MPLASIAGAMHYPSMTNATTPERTIETLRTWKVRSSARGVELTINGRTFELGATSDALVFALQRATSGHQDADATGDIA